MKKVIWFFMFLFFCTLNIDAQKNTVYFGNVNDKISIGVGMPYDLRNNITFSIMQLDKSKSFDDFTFKCVDNDGKDINIDLKVDTIYHLDIDKVYAHQIDYTLTGKEYFDLCRNLNNVSTVVYINGYEYNGAAFVGIIRALEHEQRTLFNGRPQEFRNMTMWHWPGHRHIEFMRFRNPNNKRDFRYIRNTNN